MTFCFSPSQPLISHFTLPSVNKDLILLLFLLSWFTFASLLHSLMALFLLLACHVPLSHFNPSSLYSHLCLLPSSLSLLSFLASFRPPPLCRAAGETGISQTAGGESAPSLSSCCVKGGWVCHGRETCVCVCVCVCSCFYNYKCLCEDPPGNKEHVSVTPHTRPAITCLLPSYDFHSVSVKTLFITNSSSRIKPRFSQ